MQAGMCGVLLSSTVGTAATLNPCASKAGTATALPTRP